MPSIPPLLERRWLGRACVVEQAPDWQAAVACGMAYVEPMRPSVFISSTSRDLGEYRQAAIDVCNGMGFVPVAMEFFETYGEGATEYSLGKLRRSDVYVGVFAHRYGFVERGQDRSVTQAEYEEAKANDLDRLVFLVDDKYAWPPDAVDKGGDAHRLAKFKAVLRGEQVVAEFTNVDSFRVQLLQALHSWQQRHSVSVEPAQDRVFPVSLKPTAPSLVVGRDADLGAVLDLLRPAPHGVVVRGWPGVGKTTFIAWLAYEPAVTQEFADGVLLARLGHRPNPAGELRRWCRALSLTDIPEAATVAELVERVADELDGRRVLLIVDDVWAVDDVAPFLMLGGGGSTVLATTRLPGIAAETVEPRHVYVLDVLSQQASLDLIAAVAPTAFAADIAACTTIVVELEGLPLALRIAAVLLERDAVLGVPLDGVVRALIDTEMLLAEQAPADRYDLSTGSVPTVGSIVALSIESLQPEDQLRFAYLAAVAPKPATFGLDALRTLWDTDEPLPTVRTLVARGLLEPVTATGRLQVHSVLVAEARRWLDQVATEAS